jgi:hypothetical protein
MLGEQTRWGAGSRTEESRVLGEQNCEKLKKGNTEGMVDHLAHRGVGGGHPSRPDPSFSEVNGLDSSPRSPQSKPAKKQTHHRSIRKKNRCGLLGAESLLLDGPTAAVPVVGTNSWRCGPSSQHVPWATRWAACRGRVRGGRDLAQAPRARWPRSGGVLDVGKIMRSEHCCAAVFNHRGGTESVAHFNRRQKPE